MITAVETKGLTKTYNGYNAVDELDLCVPEGAVYGFLGPNGAGKTTTLKMLTGMIRPNSGDIYIYGRKTRFGNFANRRSIGFLPDVPGFYDWMTSVEYLSFCGSLFNITGTEITRKSDELLDMVGLKNESKKKIGGFSRGMKQRLGIAQALINDPKIIFLDEPVSALDPVGRKEVMEIISGLWGKITVFFSTHVLADVERVCDRVIIINKGKKLLEDTIENIKALNPAGEIEIEFENEDTSDIISDFKVVKWIEKLNEINKKRVKLTSSEISKAMVELPGMISAKGIGIKRFNVLEPTLEDIFLRVVNKE